MGIYAGPNVTNSNLSLFLDTANRKTSVESAGNQVSYLNTDSWSIGTGSVAGYGVNGGATESQRLYDSDPWGNQNIVWGTYPLGDGYADGGWNGDYFSINSQKTYRYSIWVKRTSSTAGGSFYFGLYTNGTNHVYSLSSGAAENNPYWHYCGIGTFTQNQWYLFVGHIFPSGYSGTTAHPTSGCYLAGNVVKSGNNGGNIPNDAKFPSDATTAMMRVYHYYCGDSTSRLQFAFPRVDLVDGNEPSISELILNSPKVLKDLSGNNNNATAVNFPLYSRNNMGSFYYNGTNHYTVPTFNNIPANQITCEAFIYPQKSGVGTGLIRGAAISCSNTMYLGIIDSVDGGNTFALHWANQTSVNRIYSWVGQIPNNQWSHIVGTYDGTTTKAYLNGVKIWETAQTGTIPSGTYVVGGYAPLLNDGVHNFIGKIATANIYNRALTAIEIKTNFDALRDRYGL